MTEEIKINKRNPITQFIRHWKKHGFKQTMKDWKRNFLILQTPELINKQKIEGNIAMLIGLLVILLVLIWGKVYYTVIAIGAGIFLSYIQLKQLLAEKQVLKDIKNQYEEVEDEKET